MKSFLEFLVEPKPICFVNFDYEVETLTGKTLKYSDKLKEVFPNSVFIDFESVYFKDTLLYLGKKCVKDYSLIFVGVVGNHYENAILLKQGADDCNVPTLWYGSPKHENNKILQTYLFNKVGIKTPKTISGVASSLKVRHIEEVLTYPIILKCVHGSQGEDVFKVENQNSLKEKLKYFEERLILVQESIPNNGSDCRVYYIGDHLALSIKRKSSDKKEFRSNLSLGGKYQRFKLDHNLLNIAKKAHEVMGFYFSGVDLIQHIDTKEWYVLEVNSAPQFSINNRVINEVLGIFIADITKYRQ